MTPSTKARTRIHHQQQQRRAAARQKLVLLAAIGLIVIGTIIVIIAAMPGSGSGHTPEFVADSLSGDPIRLSDYRGQVVMLNFWATWCPPCRAEMPTINAAYQQYSDQGFTVLAINNAESPAKIQPFATDLGLQFPIVLDLRSNLSRQFGINAYPTSVFIGPDGEIYASHSGMINASQIESYIETGLSKLPA